MSAGQSPARCPSPRRDAAPNLRAGDAHFFQAIAAWLQDDACSSLYTRAMRAPGSAPRDFRALYDAHFRLVWSALARLGVRDADLMDATQKVFLTAYLKLPDFEGRSQLSTWLWGICRRIALAYRRSAVARYEVVTDPGSLTESSELLIASTVGHVETEQSAELERVLAKLSEAQRLVFLLFEVDELSGPEIAELLGVSLGTVRSRLRYARAIFRREAQRLVLRRAARSRKA